MSFIVSTPTKSSDPPKSFRYVEIPTTPPTVSFKGLASGGTGVAEASNLGDTKLVIALSNFKKDTLENMRVKITNKATGNVQATLSSSTRRANTAGLSLTSDICPTDISPPCTGGTRVRFTMPDVSPDSGDHLFEVYSVRNESLSATAVIKVHPKS